VLVIGIGAVGLGFAWWQQWRLAQERGSDPALLMPPQAVALSFAGLLAFGCYLVWLTLFLTRIRPWLATWLGGQLGVTIQERFKGHWSVATPGRLGAGLLVTLADIVFLLLGTMGPFVLVLTGLLLVGMV
jgi:hypothetical protein